MIAKKSNTDMCDAQTALLATLEGRKMYEEPSGSDSHILLQQNEAFDGNVVLGNHYHYRPHGPAKSTQKFLVTLT